MIAKRYEKLYGATVEKRAKISVDLRYNANHNPMAIWHDVPITVDDVVNSRIVADPLHLLECVMIGRKTNRREADLLKDLSNMRISAPDRFPLARPRLTAVG